MSIWINILVEKCFGVVKEIERVYKLARGIAGRQPILVSPLHLSFRLTAKAISRGVYKTGVLNQEVILTGPTAAAYARRLHSSLLGCHVPYTSPN